MGWSLCSHILSKHGGCTDSSTGYDSPSTGGQEHSAPADYLMSLALATNQPLHASAILIHIY